MLPLLTIFGGSNGSGKSSIIRRAEFEGSHNLLEADAIAKRTSQDRPNQAAIAAGREVIRRTQEYIEGRVDGPELAIQRIRERVAQGGHDVEDDDVRRRYSRSRTLELASADLG